MSNNIKKKLKWFVKNKEYLIFYFLLILGLLSTLYVEYRFQFSQFKWMGWRVLIISVAVIQFGILPKKFRKKIKPLISKILFIFIFLYIVNFLANLINIYELERFKNFNLFCEKNADICNFISKNFYQFKIYRFVSLTSYFFFYVIFLLTGMVFTEEIYRKTSKIWSKMPKVKLKVRMEYSWLFYFLITFLIFQQLILVFSNISKTTVKIIDTLKLPFEERWEPAMGGRFSFGWMDTYGKFVNSQTREDAIILIPNQEAPWEMEGNPYYVRWFFYPRRTTQLFVFEEIPDEISYAQAPEEDNYAKVPDEANYILITYGVFGSKKETFPNFFIEKEKINKIILINRETLETSIVKNEDFYPKDFEKKWGLIELGGPNENN